MKQQQKFWILLGWVLLVPVLGRAAPPVIALPDTVSAPDSTKRGWWTVGLESSNNSSFYGRNTAKQYPYAAATVTYMHRSGLWASSSSYQLFNTESYLDETDVSLGYNFQIRQRIDASMSYSRFIFSKNNPLLKAVTANALSAKAALDWKILYSGLTTSYIFGGGNDVFLVLENSRYVPLNPLWKGKHAIGLDPKISIIAGTQRFSETHTTTTQKNNTTSGSSPKSSTPVGGVLDLLKPGNGNNGSNSNGSNGSTTTTTTTTTQVSRFKVLNYEVKVPVVVTIDNWEIEPSWRYSIPVNLLEGDASKAQSFYALNLSYTF